MPNQRLRAVMAAGGWTHESLAEEAGVVPKSTERWVNLGRTPRRATAVRAAEILGEDVHALWLAPRQARPAWAVSPELVALYDQRADLPVSVFVDLIAQARECIDVLCGGVPARGVPPAQRAGEGAGRRRVHGPYRPRGRGQSQRPTTRPRGALRARHESRCRLALMHYRPLGGVPGIEVRTHGTTLYNSLYRSDEQMLVNAHVCGVNAYGAPVWHLRRNGAGGLFDTYAESFDSVWATGQAVIE